MSEHDELKTAETSTAKIPHITWSCCFCEREFKSLHEADIPKTEKGDAICEQCQAKQAPSAYYPEHLPEEEDKGMTADQHIGSLRVSRRIHRDILKKLETRLAALAEKVQHLDVFLEKHEHVGLNTVLDVLERRLAKVEADLKQLRSIQHDHTHPDILERMAEGNALHEGTDAAFSAVHERLQWLEAMAVKLDTSPPAKQPAWYQDIEERLAKLEKKP